MLLLLELHCSAGLFQLGLERVGVLPAESLLNGVGRLVYEGLGLLEAETGSSADLLDDLYLLLARRLQDDVELGLLLLGSRRGSVAAGGSRGGSCEGRGRPAELLLEHLDQFGDLQNRLLLDRVEYLLVT